MQSNILLIISGSIAAYKSLELIRRLKERGMRVRCILTAGGAEFITPLSVASLSGEPVYSDLFSLKDETEMGHIRLTREAALVVAAPASADLIAKMAQGRADDLATAALLASDKQVLVAPAMNARMWSHPATQRNLRQIAQDGAIVIAPGQGALACGEMGEGRMAEVEVIIEAILNYSPSPLVGEGWGGGEPSMGELPNALHHPPLPNPPPLGGRELCGMKALVTSGPTYEPIDPVRFLGNRSSGRQGHAIAAVLARQGAQVTLVTGPTALSDPTGVTAIHVATAEEMLKACQAALPVDIAVCAAAVSDWRAAEPSPRKLKKSAPSLPPPQAGWVSTAVSSILTHPACGGGKGGEFALKLAENPDILVHLSRHSSRPRLVIGFAAETENLEQNAADKRARKGCDWMLANDVSNGKGFDAEDNEVTLITERGSERWSYMSKEMIARRLVEKIVETMA